MISEPAARARRILLLVLAGTIAVRVVLAAITPMTGDEAYFVLWARHLDYGYYDHPPMVGWMLAALLKLDDAEVIMRAPVIALTALIAWLVYRLFAHIDAQRAAWAASAFALAPVNALNVLITTDTPLILFCFLSIAALYLALRGDRPLYYALSGLALGLAFLSKYFALLLGLAYAAFFVASARTATRWRGFAVLALCALPFVAVNVYWNYRHCWANLMFNVYNRNRDETVSAKKIVTYLVMMVYLITPIVLYYLIRARAELARLAAKHGMGVFGFALLVPLAMFLVLSTLKVIGLHWVLAFYPFLFVLLIAWLDAERLRRCVKFMAWFTGAHLLAIGAFAATPLEMWKGNRQYDGLVFLFRMPELLKALEPYQANYHFATEGYTAASILSYEYHGKRLVSVFGAGGQHARQDDTWTDFRTLDRQNIAILLNKPPELEKYAPYFDSLDTATKELAGYPFHVVLGSRFRYSAYRDGVLRAVKDKYYRIPGYLAIGGCKFCERYFPTEPCAR